MTMRQVRALAVLLLIGLAGAGPLAGQAITLSVPQFIDRLDALHAAIEAAADDASQLESIAREIPPIWKVDDGSRSFEVPLSGLIRDLETLPADGEARNRVLAGLTTLRSEARLFLEPPKEAAGQHALLESILSAREFRGLRGPTFMERLRQRLLQWLARFVDRLFGVSAIPTVGSALVYALIAAALGTVAFLTLRIIRRTEAVEHVVPVQVAPSKKEWTSWLAEADAAATSGHWREAIHAAYWCAVSWLEGQGAWRPDRTRTPREYPWLIPPSSPNHVTLSAMARQFERVWYGDAQADADAFAEAKTGLKDIGCPSS